jgi:hypothetical protein
MKSGVEIDSVLKTYPRARTVLSPAHQAVYEEEYRRNRHGEGRLLAITSWMESWMHRGVARGRSEGERLLEIGAGTLNHVPYERNVSVYDAVEPWQSLWQDSPNRDAVQHLYADVAEVDYANRYDRIISIAVLEHLTDLPSTIARCGLLLAPGGSFRAGIPTEGGFLWALGWRLTTGVAYRLRRGIDYAAVMQHEHVNNAREILAVVRYFFESVTEHRFPLPLFHVSFYTVLEAKRPNLNRCKRWLS